MNQSLRLAYARALLAHDHAWRELSLAQSRLEAAAAEVERTLLTLTKELDPYAFTK